LQVQRVGQGARAYLDGDVDAVDPAQRRLVHDGGGLLPLKAAHQLPEGGVGEVRRDQLQRVADELFLAVAQLCQQRP
jgi:hypothetical protein